MPIHNLTTETAKAFMRLGNIRKGDRGGKNNAPRDLDHFRITYLPGKHAEELQRTIESVYGKTPPPRSISDSLITPLGKFGMQIMSAISKADSLPKRTPMPMAPIGIFTAILTAPKCLYVMVPPLESMDNVFLRSRSPWTPRSTKTLKVRACS